MADKRIQQKNRYKKIEQNGIEKAESGKRKIFVRREIAEKDEKKKKEIEMSDTLFIFYEKRNAKKG